MKKFLPLALFVALMMTSCGLDEIKVGTIKYQNVTEEVLDKSLEENDLITHDVPQRHIFFNDFNSMVAGLESGQIDEISTYETVAMYMESISPKFQRKTVNEGISDMFCCAMLKENSALKTEFDAAITELADNGKLAKLERFYLKETIRGEVPDAVELPTIYGAPTVRIGVTGDLPLLDYIRPDGQPAGFNTAVLAEISNIIGKNFFLVQIESGARAAALSSKQVDVIFWAVSPQHEQIRPKDFDVPEGMILTKPYFSDEIVRVKLSDEVNQ